MRVPVFVYVQFSEIPASTVVDGSNPMHTIYICVLHFLFKDFLLVKHFIQATTKHNNERLLCGKFDFGLGVYFVQSTRLCEAPNILITNQPNYIVLF